MTMEIKVYYRKKIRVKKIEIDHIPKCFQLPRSVVSSKRRTDFSFGMCCFKDMSNDAVSGTVDPSPAKSTKSQNRRRKTVTKGKHVSLTYVKSFGGKAHLQPCSKRKDEDSDDDALELSPTKSQLTENSDVADGSNDQLSERDSSPSSNKAGTNSTGRARSQRERKRKVHFDEVSCPVYTSRKVRRFKVMRSLGLAAPVGSPFNSSSMHF